MTLQESIDEMRRVGSIRVENGKLKLRFPEPERARLEPAIQILRQNREAALEAVAISEAIPPPIESWPESLLDLAQERAAQIGDAPASTGRNLDFLVRMEGAGTEPALRGARLNRPIGADKARNYQEWHGTRTALRESGPMNAEPRGKRELEQWRPRTANGCER